MVPVVTEALEPLGEVQALLEDSWQVRQQRLPRRELVFEGALSLATVAACLVLLVLAPSAVTWSLPLVCAFAAYTIAAGVAYPMGAGNIVPTQPFLVLLFVTAPPPLVPLLVCAALVVVRIVEAVLRRT